MMMVCSLVGCGRLALLVGLDVRWLLRYVVRGRLVSCPTALSSLASFASCFHCSPAPLLPCFLAPGLSLSCLLLPGFPVPLMVDVPCWCDDSRASWSLRSGG